MDAVEREVDVVRSARTSSATGRAYPGPADAMLEGNAMRVIRKRFASA